MKQAWTDLKSFVTVSMIVLLAIIVMAGLFGYNLADNLLVLVTNLVTAVFTYYFTKKENIENNSIVEDTNIESEENANENND